ncbi:MAG TPA: alpha-L-rhamnosidase [Lentisphaeria bacterium]|nr:MAG: alpha-L-rhamnosidase [Lentisphaerae bacterium GWF2_49_21]HBC88868.1 alpha-L-rhamnosidase [Lentisphaeria bacterium]
MNIGKLRCEYLKNPVGVDVVKPRLGWIVGSDVRGQGQSSCQILVASSSELLSQDKGDLWDSGKMETDQSSHVEYSGKNLKSRDVCFWKVKIWDKDGKESAWSETASWEMGLLKPADWKAKWIASGIKAAVDKSSPAPYLRKKFKLKKSVKKARLYVSALGLYEMEINGRRVGTDLFTPGWTDYNLRVQYQTYDVTPLIWEGDNAIGGILGDGWFCGFLVWENNRNTYGHPPRLFSQLEIEYSDGGRELIVSDDSWKSSTGPILESDIYNGEIYDARLEMKGWSCPEFDDSQWKSVEVHPATSATLNASPSPRVHKIQELKSSLQTEQTPGTFIFDFGQNLVGWTRLKVQGDKGTTVKLRFAEILNPDGTLYTTNLRSARCTDEYILKGEGVETYEPRFTFHGFRYAEITGFPGKPSAETLTAVVLHSDTPPTGSFSCSNPMLNQLQHNIQWGQKGNFLEVPTDCPQRNERLGWTGDAQAFVRTACFNMDVSAFFTKWLTDLADSQSPNGAFPMVAPDVLGKREGDGGAGWADAAIICPWTIYLCYGDKRILATHYKKMTSYLDYLSTVDLKKRHCFGDWLNINDNTPKELIGTAFHAYCVKIMANVADVLEKKGDAKRYCSLFGKIKKAFNHEFVTPSGRIVNGSQTSYVLAIHFDLLSEERTKVAGENLVQRIGECNNHLSTGFLGTPYLLFALLKTGHADLAYKLLLNDDFPSWGYPIKHGATTMWERWDGWRHDKGFQDPGMNSFNHYAYGAVGEWLYQTVAGIDIDISSAGYKNIIMRPLPGGGLTQAEASLESVRGKISSSWKIENGKFIWGIAVPAGSTATIHVPAKDSASVLEGGKPASNSSGVEFLKMENDRAVFKIVSGKYQFQGSV